MNSKKFIIIMIIIMISTTIFQYVLKEFEFVEKISAIIDEVLQGLISLKAIR